MTNTYAGYLGLQRLLSAQTLQTSSDDELLFIIIHQQHELWFKLAIHELDCAIQSLMKEGAHEGDCIIAFKRLSRVSAIQHILISTWDVLATLTPDEFILFRETVGKDGASGFQSIQYRILEYKLGLKYDSIAFELPDGETRTVDVFANAQTDEERVALRGALAAPGIYDAVISYMAKTLPTFGIEDTRSGEYSPISKECGSLQGVEPCLQKSDERAGIVSARREADRLGGRFPKMALCASRHGISGHRQQCRDRRVERVEISEAGRQPALRRSDVPGAVGCPKRDVQPAEGIRPGRSGIQRTGTVYGGLTMGGSSRGSSCGGPVDQV
jgi:tryptophan 2,3-dioxygenase